MKQINNTIVPLLDARKNKVWDVCETLNPYSGLLTIKETIENVLELEEKGIWISLEIEVPDSDGYDRNWYVMGYREETDKERDERIKLEEKQRREKEKQKQKKLEREQKEYERLKKKFEKGK